LKLKLKIEHELNTNKHSPNKLKHGYTV